MALISSEGEYWLVAALFHLISSFVSLILRAPIVWGVVGTLLTAHAVLVFLQLLNWRGMCWGSQTQQQPRVFIVESSVLAQAHLQCAGNRRKCAVGRGWWYNPRAVHLSLHSLTSAACQFEAKPLCESSWKQRGPVPCGTVNSTSITKKGQGPELAWRRNKLSLPLCVSDFWGC